MTDPPLDREHVVEVYPCDMEALRLWLSRPNGSLWLGRVTFNAVEGGGILIRTQPYSYGTKESSASRP